MSITKNKFLVSMVKKNIAGGLEKKESLPTPGNRFEKLGTIFSRVLGLIKSGVMKQEDIPIWFLVYKSFPPKYEPQFSRPPLDVDVKDIYYPEDKLRAAMKRWETLDLRSTTPNASQELVATFKEKRSSNSNDAALIKELLAGNRGEKRNINP
ncbi:28S ribosomal protein S23, mitochondrial [Frankliniella fusca]|uniref:Small ribosomal subunit protein mS23 n=1 Tax=Frankliniella fusca TaxID=407009 RepID=A0AAE1LB84_9NEOP|nr:28S ribosomal protein S23, mitochondrial [Frankliniella fusca]